MPNLFLQLSDGQDTPVVSGATLDEGVALDVLRRAEISATKLIPWGSNYSFAVGLVGENATHYLAIYKPREGEAPLHDFPHGTLYQREVAAYQVSRDLGWNIVPPTVIRDGIHGVGSLQLYVEPMPEEEDDPRRFWSQSTIDIERIVLFDLIANNADRKLSHCLRDTGGRLWGIDHGLTFNAVPKLRTVLWQFVECEVAPVLLQDLERYRAVPEHLAALRGLLSGQEIAAFAARLDRVIETGRYPRLNPYRNVPYGWW